ncbi:MAG TPA: hypothetical protein VER17_20305 [Tepidisphaeraceae bacterium]|nr:hypothetical protein [Tepidisphaeraceae bacterium]
MAELMDSPAAIAFAHFLHLALFFLCPRLREAACPLEVAAHRRRGRR